MKQNIVIFGATSAIAEQAARVWAKRGDQLVLVGRNSDKLSAIAQDLKVRGASQTTVKTTDLNRVENHPALITEIERELGRIDVILVAHGLLGDQRQAEKDFVAAQAIWQTNFVSAASLMSLLAPILEKQKSGTIAAISSVAGDRGRQSNYFYGSSKGALSIFLSGLRNRLFQSQVNVLTIKPGFVDTPMTADFKKGALWASSETVGQGIVRAIDKKRAIVYLPGFWRLIMTIICSIPETHVVPCLPA
ncbi:MAG: SDR family oxidoreductase [Bdellovibrionia bacterium]